MDSGYKNSYSASFKSDDHRLEGQLCMDRERDMHMFGERVEESGPRPGLTVVGTVMKEWMDLHVSSGPWIRFLSAGPARIVRPIRGALALVEETRQRPSLGGIQAHCSLTST